MPYLYLVISVFGVASLSVFGAFYNRKNGEKAGASTLYTLVLIATVSCLWAIMFLIEGEYNWKVLPYSLGFAIGYVACLIANVNALKTGPVVLTALMMQLSLIGVTIWGFFFWGSPFTLLVAVGLVLIVLALWLCLYTKKKEENKITWRWILWASAMFLGNCVCSIFQRTQQVKFGGKFGNFTMMWAMLFALVVCFALYLKSDKSETKEILKKSWQFPVLSGVFNGVLNLCVILLATSPLSPSLVYPVIAVGGIAVNTVFSAFVFKEKMRWWQWLGVLVGAVAVGILSI